jgi:hypothetical protein
VATNAPWVVIGSFTVPLAIEANLNVAGLNTGPAVLSVAVYGPELVENSTVVLANAQEANVLSSPMQLAPGITYQIAVQYEGASGSGVIRTVSLGSP